MIIFFDLHMCLAHQRADVFCKFCAGMHHRVALGAECHVAGGAEVQLDAVPANDTARPRLHSKLHNNGRVVFLARRIPVAR